MKSFINETARIKLEAENKHAAGMVTEPEYTRPAISHPMPVPLGEIIDITIITNELGRDS